MNGMMIEVELCCPVCGEGKRHWVWWVPETLKYKCLNLDCEASGRDDLFNTRVFSWDPAYCKVIGPPEVVAAIAQGKQDVRDYLDRVIVNPKRSRSRQWQLDQAKAAVAALHPVAQEIQSDRPVPECLKLSLPATLVEDGDVGTLAAERACGMHERIG